MSHILPLSRAQQGDRGVIVRVGDPGDQKEHAKELERRLLELGFVEGAQFELLHEGLFGRDPIAMKVDDMRVALRRHEAALLTVSLEPTTVAASTVLQPEEAAA
ncbi:MAG: FeoA family protein [Brevundimonas sp.]|nr:FeoA family protein [Brevundimonas sp.]